MAALWAAAWVETVPLAAPGLDKRAAMQMNAEVVAEVVAAVWRARLRQVAAGAEAVEAIPAIPETLEMQVTQAPTQLTTAFL
jgi:hypothetical protein